MKLDVVGLILQTIMITGLGLVILLLILPIFINASPKNSAKPVQFVLEVLNSNTGIQQAIIARIKKLLEQHSGQTQIEVVTAEKGVYFLLNDTRYFADIQKLMDKGVVFTVCQKTLSNLSQKLGSSLETLKGVKFVGDGRLYAEQLKESGYIDELL